MFVLCLYLSVEFFCVQVSAAHLHGLPTYLLQRAVESAVPGARLDSASFKNRRFLVNLLRSQKFVYSALEPSALARLALPVRKATSPPRAASPEPTSLPTPPSQPTAGTDAGLTPTRSHSSSKAAFAEECDDAESAGGSGMGASPSEETRVLTAGDWGFVNKDPLLAIVELRTGSRPNSRMTATEILLLAQALQPPVMFNELPLAVREKIYLADMKAASYEATRTENVPESRALAAADWQLVTVPELQQIMLLRHPEAKVPTRRAEVLAEVQALSPPVMYKDLPLAARQKNDWRVTCAELDCHSVAAEDWERLTVVQLMDIMVMRTGLPQRPPAHKQDILDLMRDLDSPLAYKELPEEARKTMGYSKHWRANFQGGRARAAAPDITNVHPTMRGAALLVGHAIQEDDIAAADVALAGDDEREDDDVEQTAAGDISLGAEVELPVQDGSPTAGGDSLVQSASVEGTARAELDHGASAADAELSTAKLPKQRWRKIKSWKLLRRQNH